MGTLMASADLDDVDDLCRLAVAARRLGCRIHLADADPELRSLIELAGIDDVLGWCPTPSTDPELTTGGLR